MIDFREFGEVLFFFGVAEHEYEHGEDGAEGEGEDEEHGECVSVGGIHGSWLVLFGVENESHGNEG